MSKPFVDPNTTLKDGEGKEISAASLWTDSPALVVVLRRPGCLLCRDQAIVLWKSRETIANYAQGTDKQPTRMVCVLHEWKQREVDAFKEYWGGEIYHDETKAFYKAVHGGRVKKGSLASFLNPFSRAWKNYRAVKARGAVCDSNLEGDGLTLGGLTVLDSPAGNSVYVFKEETFGDHAPMASVMKAVASLYGK